MKKLIFLMIGLVFVVGAEIEECNKGNAEACYELGIMYYGNDYKKSAEYHKKACDGGYMQSCLLLGYLYEDGKGVKQNYKKAYELLKKACNGGNTQGCCELGYLYKDGEGVTKNYHTAYEYWRKAANQGDGLAAYYLKELCKDYPWVCK